MLTTTNNHSRKILEQTARTEVVRVRLTTLEKEDLTKRAAETGEKSVSDYIRKRAFGAVYTVPAINQEACSELRKMSMEVCQLAKLVEKAVQTGQISEQSMELIEKFCQKIREYHQELRGNSFAELLGIQVKPQVITKPQD